jgi:hypothetical protein
MITDRTTVGVTSKASSTRATPGAALTNPASRCSVPISSSAMPWATAKTMGKRSSPVNVKGMTSS